MQNQRAQASEQKRWQPMNVERVKATRRGHIGGASPVQHIRASSSALLVLALFVSPHRPPGENVRDPHHAIQRPNWIATQDPLRKREPASVLPRAARRSSSLPTPPSASLFLGRTGGAVDPVAGALLRPSRFSRAPAFAFPFPQKSAEQDDGREQKFLPALAHSCFSLRRFRCSLTASTSAAVITTVVSPIRTISEHQSIFMLPSGAGIIRTRKAKGPTAHLPRSPQRRIAEQGRRQCFRCRQSRTPAKRPVGCD